MHIPISKVYRIIDSLSGRRKPRAPYASLALSRGTNIANIAEEFADSYLVASRSGDPSGHKLGLNLLLWSGQDHGGEHQWAPRFVKHPEGGYVSLGQRRGLHCDAVGSPAPRLRLLRDGQPLTNWTGTTRLLHVLSHVELSHAGLYQCVANNSAGSVLSRAAKLRVAHLTASEPVSKTVTVQVRRGSPVVLDPPRAESVPAATATWMRLSGDASGSEPLEGIQYATTQDNRLVILEARFEDQGRYQVELTNPHTGEFLLGPLLELEVEGESVEEDGPHKLSIVVPPSESEFNNLGNGYDNTLECIAAGSPLEEVRVSWLKGGQPLRGLPHALTHWNRTLTLLNVGPEHEGTYTCRASLGEDALEAHANVTVAVRAQWTPRAIPADPAPGESRVTCRWGGATQGAQGRMTLPQRRIDWDGS
ncbi:hypothetical protein ISCGN_002357 [Ixodes scapularis]